MNALIALVSILIVFTLVSIPKILSVRKYEKTQSQHGEINKILSEEEIKEFLVDVTSNDT